MADGTSSKEAPSPETLQRLDKQAEALLRIIENWQRSEIGKLGNDTTTMQGLEGKLLDKNNRTPKGMEAIFLELNTFVQKVSDKQQELFQRFIKLRDTLKEGKAFITVQANANKVVEAQKEVGLVVSKVLTTIQDVTMMDAIPTRTAEETSEEKLDDQISSLEDASRSNSQGAQLDNVTKGVRDIQLQPSQMGHSG